MSGSFKVKLNSSEKVKELLQEIYDVANRQNIEIQNEIAKMDTINVVDEPMSEKTKYWKAKHDFYQDKDRALNKKMEVAKFLQEVIKFDGDLNKALNNPDLVKTSTLDLNKIREMVQEASDTTPKEKTYTLGKS
jgi:DNA-binding transcriptional regulator GbsR (MarR family)